MAGRARREYRLGEAAGRARRSLVFSWIVCALLSDLPNRFPHQPEQGLQNLFHVVRIDLRLVVVQQARDDGSESPILLRKGLDSGTDSGVYALHRRSIPCNRENYRGSRA